MTLDSEPAKAASASTPRDLLIPNPKGRLREQFHEVARFKHLALKLDDFLELATQGNLIPVTRRILADFETPLSAYKKIRGQGESFLFESAARTEVSRQRGDAGPVWVQGGHRLR